ncbi:MAG: MBL fold metallo-hydrolase [Parcubacteria group bacterium]|nr:MBL fold metallo-hydrolase [Parcubacteria group bacterium]
MNIQWFGHSCFRIESKNSSILIDPFAKEIGLTQPRFHDTIILITHEHYDHNALKDLNEGVMVIREPGEYERQGVFIKGIQSFHDAVQGKERGLNTIFRIETEEIRICHMGDFGQGKLDEEQIEAIGDIDILMIPVGGVYTIDGKQALEIVEQIEPKIVIPMHFKIPGLKIELNGAERFLKEIGITPEKTDKLKIVKKALPQEEMKVVMFQL